MQVGELINLINTIKKTDDGLNKLLKMLEKLNSYNEITGMDGQFLKMEEQRAKKTMSEWLDSIW